MDLIRELFDHRVLTNTINEIRTGMTTVLDTIFQDKDPQTSDKFQIDIITGSQEIMRSIDVHSEAQIAPKTSGKTILIQAPRFSEKVHIEAAELNGIRELGRRDAAELLMRKISRESTNLRGRVDRTREVMAVSALRGVVTDGAGQELITYEIPDSHKPDQFISSSASTPGVLGTNLAWDSLTDAQADQLLKDIRGWQRIIEDDVPLPIDRWVAFCGWKVMDSITFNTGLKDLFKYERGSDVVSRGRFVGQLAGMEVIEYNGTYKTDDDSETSTVRFVEPHEMIIVGWNNSFFSEKYAPQVRLNAPGGVGTGRLPEMFYSESWEVNDPSGRTLMVEARPLPVVHVPEAILYAQPVTGTTRA